MSKSSNVLKFRRWHRWPRGWRHDPQIEDLASRQVIGQVLAELRPMVTPQPPDPVDLALAAALVHGDDVRQLASSHGWPIRRIRNRQAAAKRALRIVRLHTCGWATGGFWHGLRIAGAIRAHHGGWRLSPGRPWLMEALANAPVAISVGATDSKGRLYFSCPAAHMSATDPYAVDVLAGLLAGGLRRQYSDGWWIVLPRTAEVLRLLDTWGLSIRSVDWRDGGAWRPMGPPSRHPSGLPSVKLTEGNHTAPMKTATDGVRVSVFYAALLRDYLPPAVADGLSAERLDRAGDCPALPVIYAGLMWDPSPPHYNWPVSAKVLPWCICSQSRIRRGWGREFVTRASERMGIAHVPLQLRALLEEYRARVVKAAE